jgi:hypothetical protein
MRLMVPLKACVADCAEGLLSLARSVYTYSPLAVGVPRIVALAPEDSSANPVGNDPALIDQL